MTDFDETSPRGILERRARAGRSRPLPRILEYCRALVLIGVGGFAVALVLAATAARGAAFAIMAASTVAIIAAMIAAVCVSMQIAVDGRRISS